MVAFLIALLLLKMFWPEHWLTRFFLAGFRFMVRLALICVVLLAVALLLLTSII